MRKIIVFLALFSTAVFAQQKGSFADPRDGKRYKTVKMPDRKTWMAENLNYAAGISVCYKNNDIICQKCGRLYDWLTATAICPIGWHLPSNQEWSNLDKAVGKSIDNKYEIISPTTGTALKSKNGWNDTENYTENYGNDIDKYGFSAFACGDRYIDGSFGSYGSQTSFWSATEEKDNDDDDWDLSAAWTWVIGTGNGPMYSFDYPKKGMVSVRCVKD